MKRKQKFNKNDSLDNIKKASQEIAELERNLQNTGMNDTEAEKQIMSILFKYNLGLKELFIIDDYVNQILKS